MLRVLVLVFLAVFWSNANSAAMCPDIDEPVCCIYGGQFKADKPNLCLCHAYSGELAYYGKCDSPPKEENTETSKDHSENIQPDDTSGSEVEEPSSEPEFE